MIGFVFYNLKTIPNICIHSTKHNSSTRKQNIVCSV